MRAVNSTYRPDIDGLRAVAVLAVLLFHVFPDVVTGGFVGVDVFFVISGFLITGILVNEVENGQFSVLRFYVRRARRLFPALALVLAVVLAFGWLTLLPVEFSQLGKHVVGGAGFVSNLVLWREAGYFDTNSELKPLLHLWSLGVEEQYYLLWPMLVALVARGGRQRLMGLTLVLAVLSFSMNVIFVDRQPTATFYLPVTRFWELLAGGLLALLDKRQASGVRMQWQAHAFAIAGLLLIGIAVVGLNASVPFPGWAAVLPVAGSALVIAAGPTAWPNARLLSSPVAVGIGLISYPLYLWHWPLIAFARVLLGDVTPSQGVVLMALSFLLAWLTYRFVERLFRQRKSHRRSAIDAGGLWATTAVLGFGGLAVWMAWVVPRSWAEPAVRVVAAAQADWEEIGNQRLAGDKPERVLFIGDSHMQQYLPRIVALMRDHKAPVYSVEFDTAAGCAPLAGIERVGMQCDLFATRALAAAGDPAVRTVVIAASWYGFSSRGDYYRVDGPGQARLAPFAPENAWIFDRWTAELRALRAAGKRVVLLTSGPGGPSATPVRRLERTPFAWHSRLAQQVPRREFQDVVAIVDARILAVAREAGAEVVNPFDWICDASSCPVADAVGRPIYKDKTHLRASWVRNSLPMLDGFVYVE